METDSDSEINYTPVEVKETALELLPLKSREVYENSYTRFMEWRTAQNINLFSEDVIIDYLAYLATKVKPSTLWSHYSMLKATLNVKHGIDIKKYTKLVPYLKRKSYGFQPKKSKTFTKEQINKFLSEAPDSKYLMTKVCLIFGVAGALRRDELSEMKLNDITDLQTSLLIKIPNTKTKKPKSFTVTGEEYLKLYRKYISLRPSHMNSDRFFIKYQNGSCHRQVVGVHKLSSTAQEVANYLCLPDVKTYTGHCLRRTSATLLVNSGADLPARKRHRGWNCFTVEESDINESLTNMLDISKRILDTDEAVYIDGVPEPVPSCSRNIEEPPTKRTAFQWTQIVEDEEERKDEFSDYYEPMISPTGSEISFASSTTPRGTNRRKRSPDEFKGQSTQVLHEVAAELKSLNRNVNVLISQNKQMMSEIRNTNNILLKISQSREVFPPRENSNSTQRQLGLNTKTIENQDKFELRTDIKVEEVSDDDLDDVIDFENVIVKSEN